MTRKTLVIIAAWWVLLLGGLWLSRQVIVWSGTQVYLKLEPVDPRDLFRGDYAILRYEISDWESLPDCKGVEMGEFETGKTVFVALRVVDGLGEPLCKAASYAVAKMPTNADIGEVVVIKGQTTYGGWRGDETIEYGIESYFVEAGSGIRVEGGKDSKALVSIGRNGKATLVGLVVDGEPI